MDPSSHILLSSRCHPSLPPPTAWAQGGGRHRPRSSPALWPGTPGFTCPQTPREHSFNREGPVLCLHPPAPRPFFFSSSPVARGARRRWRCTRGCGGRAPRSASPTTCSPPGSSPPGSPTCPPRPPDNLRHAGRRGGSFPGPGGPNCHTKGTEESRECNRTRRGAGVRPSGRMETRGAPVGLETPERDSNFECQAAPDCSCPCQTHCGVGGGTAL